MGSNRIISVMDENEQKKVDSERIVSIMVENEKKRKKNIARFHKCIFHMHSPVSHDYKLIDGVKNWGELSEEDLLRIAEEKELPLNLISKDHLDSLAKDVYDSRLELLAFFLLAHELMSKEIELVVLTDHNTISGYHKLVKSITMLYEQFKGCYKVCTEIILGIEISCSDKCHVVGIFDEKRHSPSLQKWIDGYIMSDNDGTYLNSIEVLEKINKIGGIGYIGHLNSLPLFNEGHVNGAYKEHLFNLEYNHFFGVSIKDEEIGEEKNNYKEIAEKKAEIQKKYISHFTQRHFNYIVDEDSHLLREVGNRSFWIKGQRLDYHMIYDALNDFQTSISHEEPTEISSYIKSLYIDNKCFYKGQNGEGMIIPFSDNMNALIGGRGTGKSTMLNIIEFLASQIVENKKTLEYIIKQGTICLLYSHKEQDYYIMFHSGGGDDNDKEFIRKCFPINNGREDIDKENERKQRKTVIQDRIQIFQYENGKTKEITQVKKLLDEMFTRKFSVNHLVNIAGNQSETVDFILDLLNKNSKLNKGISLSPSGKRWIWIDKKYKDLNKILSERRKEVNKVINPFNTSQDKKIRITYRQKKIEEFGFNWRWILGVYSEDFSKPFSNYNITNESVIGLLEYLSSLTNPIDVALKFYKREYEAFINCVDISRYCMDNSIENINRSLEKLNKENINNFFDAVKDKICNGERKICDFLRKYLKEVESFGLDFNINNKESTQNLGVLFKPIDEVSMGQKVVAMISFILEYSKFTNDLSPLIIDQPEDNLDNQYIYRNLVKDFRSIKNSRQIIIATHNSTILINSGCENVIILQSDNERAWMEKNGYSKKKEINRRVINILEGGVEAFQNKVKIYRENIDFKKIY